MPRKIRSLELCSRLPSTNGDKALQGFSVLRRGKRGLSEHIIVSLYFMSSYFAGRSKNRYDAS